MVHDKTALSGDEGRRTLVVRSFVFKCHLRHHIAFFHEQLRYRGTTVIRVALSCAFNLATSHRAKLGDGHGAVVEDLTTSPGATAACCPV